MGMVTLEEIQNYANKIAERYHPEKIILFGSYARGNPTKDSDVDLMVLMDYAGKSYDKATEISLAIEPSFAMDLLVRRKIDFAMRIGERDPFFQDVAKGLTLYEG